MDTGKRTRISLATGLSCILLAAVWLLFAPSRVGGQTDYVIVNGNSMEPSHHRGDLVLVRTADSYAIGDIVTYRHPQIGPVIHRIVGRDGERYILQGDNNDWRDAYQPTQADLIGKEWVRIPGIGAWLAKLRAPQHLALLAGLMGVIAMASLSNERTKHGEDARTPATSPATPLRPRFDRALAREWLNVALLIAVAAGVAMLLSFNRAPQRAAQAQAGYTQTGQFAYTTAEDAGDGIYDQGAATAGEPIFRQVSDAVALSFQYVVAPEVSDPGAFSGTWRMDAEISDVNGWKRTLELQPRTTFEGAAFNATATLAFADIQAVIERVEQQTGVDRAQYHLAIVPYVELHGTLAGRALGDTFAPRLEFLVDDLQLQVAAPPDEVTAALAPSQSGAVVWPALAENTIPILAWQIDVNTARAIALAVFALALVVLACGWLALTILFPAGEIAPTADVPADAIEVRAWSDLLELSQRFSAPVETRGDEHERRYIVEGGGLTYALLERAGSGPRAQTA